MKGIVTGLAAMVAVLLLFFASVFVFSGIKTGFSNPLLYDGRAIYAHFYPLPEVILAAVFLLGCMWQVEWRKSRRRGAARELKSTREKRPGRRSTGGDGN